MRQVHSADSQSKVLPDEEDVGKGPEAEAGKGAMEQAIKPLDFTRLDPPYAEHHGFESAKEAGDGAVDGGVAIFRSLLQPRRAHAHAPLVEESVV